MKCDYHSSLFRWTLLFLTAIFVSPLAAQPAPSTIFTDVTAPSAARRIGESSNWIMRERLLALDATELIRLINNSASQSDISAVRLRVPIFDDTHVIAQLNTISRTRSGNINLRGSIEGATDSLVTLMLTPDKVLVGSVTIGTEQYQLRYRGNGRHALQDIDETVFRPELPPRHVPGLADAIPRSRRAVASAAAAEGDTTLDVMVVYTRASRASRGGTSAINAEIDLAISETNVGYKNSAVSQQLRLVHTAEVEYNESGMNRSLDDVTDYKSDGNGPLDEAHRLRNAFGADLVMLITTDRVYCGIAWIMDTLTVSFESSAFSVVSSDCLVTNSGFSSGHVVGHEFGHNLGLAHDRITGDGGGLHEYSHGYINEQFGWRTIMAYDRCTFRRCSPVNYYSNPDISYNGEPLGVANRDANSANNALTLNLSAATAATFRTRESVTPPSMVLPVPDSRLDSDMQTFTWTANDTNVSSWGLKIGSSPGSSDYFNQNGITATSINVSNLPTRGEPLFVTLNYTVNETTNTLEYEYLSTSLAFLPVINISNTTIKEDAGRATVTVTLTTPAVEPVSAILSTSDGTATAGEDYSTISTIVYFLEGQITQTVDIPIVDDTLAESNSEFFSVNLIEITGAGEGSVIASVTVVDDDTEQSIAEVPMTFDSRIDTVYGHRVDGTSAVDGVLITFFSDGGDARLTFNSYDIDINGEVSVWLNGEFVATARVGRNNKYNGGDVILLDKERLLPKADNEIQIKQNTSGWRWGIKNLLLTKLQAGNEVSMVSGQIKRAPRGWNFGRNSHVGAVVINFPGATVDQFLQVTGYDIDSRTEATVYLNGRRIGALRVGRNNALNAGNNFRLRTARQRPGNNRLVIVQKRPSYTWGVRDLQLQ